MTAAERKQKKELKELLDRIEDFFDKKVEPHVKNGWKKMETVGKKDVKVLLDELEAFFDDKVQPKVKELLSKEIRLKDSKLLEYDPDSPFSYVTAFLRDKAVASVAPSTKFVVRRVLKALALDRAKVVVEFGPAEGVMTRQILERLGADGAVIAIERNENFVKALRRIKDRRLRVVHGDVQDVDRIVADNGFESVDRVVSGIPFSFFDPPGRHRLLEKIRDLLDRDGRFVAYQFTTHLIPLLKRYFSKVDTEFEIRNLPPHFVFTSHK